MNQRKELVIQYVNRLNGLTKQEKLLLLNLAGYKTTEDNQRVLSKYLRENGMDKNQINAYLGVE